MADDLRDFIISWIRTAGPVSFSQFMEWCLYHPTLGYYSSGVAGIGREGDYYTAPCVHPLFGGLVARQLCQMGEVLTDENFTILEVGGGRGFLCADILAWIEKQDRELYQRLDYAIIERSPFFLREQQKLLEKEAREGKVRWLSEGILNSGKLSLKGCVLSNELVDAFPVNRVIIQGGELREILVDVQDGRFVETYESLSDKRLSQYFSALDIKLSEGQRAEVNLQALEWLEDMERSLSRGFLMTIDYGFRAEELYDPWRRQGSLRCFFRHQLADSPYENVGRQDITAHVDFTSLIRKGEEIGLHLTGLVPQYRFLLALGLLEEITIAAKDLSSRESLELRLAMKNLIEPERGMGEIFKVLIQHKGMEKPELRGLKELSTVKVQE